MEDKICLFCGKKLVSNIDSAYWHESCIMSFFGEKTIPMFDFNEESIKYFASNNVSDGNVVGGVQKKLSFEFKSKRKKKLLVSKKYIIKPHENKYPLLNVYEWVGNRLAALCGFKVVQAGLIKTKDGTFCYVTKRADRKIVDEQIVKLPMEDFAQLSETLTENKYVGSYEKAYKKVILKYSENLLFDTVEYFRMIFFSYVIGNTDMHLKNFSLLKENQFYMLSPFYDILPVLMIVDQTDMALTINGKSRNLTQNDFVKFGKSISLDERLIYMAMNSVLSKLDNMYSFIETSPLNKEEQSKLISFIKNRTENFKIKQF